MRPWSVLSATCFAALFCADLVEAQNSSTIALLSECARLCFINYVPQSGCDPVNAKCLCTSSYYNEIVGGCLHTNCTPQEALHAQRYSDICCEVPIRNTSGSTRRVQWVTYALAAPSVLLRFIFVHTRSSLNYGAEDWTILAALILATPFNAILESAGKLGIGKDIWWLAFDDISEVLNFSWIAEQLHILVMSLAKISTLLLYLRVYPRNEKRNGTPRFQSCCLVLISINVAATVAFYLSLAFECTPVSYAWTHWDGEHEGYCIDLVARILALAVYNVAMDVSVYSLPIFILTRARNANFDHAGIALLFLVGIIITICGILRLHSLIGPANNPNAIWMYNRSAIWSLVEDNLSVICACVPAIFELLARHMRRWRRKSAAQDSQVQLSMGPYENELTVPEYGSFSQGSATTSILENINKMDPNQTRRRSVGPRESTLQDVV